MPTITIDETKQYLVLSPQGQLKTFFGSDIERLTKQGWRVVTWDYYREKYAEFEDLKRQKAAELKELNDLLETVANPYAK